jgi:hypothetical protein
MKSVLVTILVWSLVLVTQMTSTSSKMVLHAEHKRACEGLLNRVWQPCEILVVDGPNDKLMEIGEKIVDG